MQVQLSETNYQIVKNSFKRLVFQMQAGSFNTKHFG